MGEVMADAVPHAVAGVKDARPLKRLRSALEGVVKDTDCSRTGFHAHHQKFAHHFGMGIGGAGDIRRKTHIGLDDHLLAGPDESRHAAEQLHGGSGRGRRAALDHGNVGRSISQKPGREPQRGSADGKRRCGLKFEKIASVHVAS